MELFHRVSHIPELSTCLEIHRLYTNDKYLNYWTSETRDISWDHIQFLESLLPKICLSIKKNSHHINYRGSHSGVKSCIIKFLVCQCRCVFIFVVIKIMNMFNATINCYPCQIAILEISTMPVLSGFFMKLLPIIV